MNYFYFWLVVVIIVIVCAYLLRKEKKVPIQERVVSPEVALKKSQAKDLFNKVRNNFYWLDIGTGKFYAFDGELDDDLKDCIAQTDFHCYVKKISGRIRVTISDIFYCEDTETQKIEYSIKQHFVVKILEQREKTYVVEGENITAEVRFDISPGCASCCKSTLKVGMDNVATFTLRSYDRGYGGVVGLAI